MRCTENIATSEFKWDEGALSKNIVVVKGRARLSFNIHVALPIDD